MKINIKGEAAKHKWQVWSDGTLSLTLFLMCFFLLSDCDPLMSDFRRPTLALRLSVRVEATAQLRSALSMGPLPRKGVVTAAASAVGSAPASPVVSVSALGAVRRCGAMAFCPGRCIRMDSSP